MTLDFDIQLLLTDTLTSTVPATLVLRLNGMPTMTVPISVVFGTVGTALVNVEPVTLTAALTDVTIGVTEAVTVGEVITLTPSLTVTEEATETAEATPTIDAEATPEPLTVITVTVPVTTNVRPGPGVNFDPVRTVAPNSVLEVVAIDQSREWLLLTEGNWIAVVVLPEAPAGLPVATTALVEQVRAEAALRTPTPTPTPLPPTVTPTPLPPTGPVTGTTTTNANLRSGPGTTFDIVGNTELGQVVTIVARNEAADWLRLDTGSWVSASLVAGLPTVTTIAVFDPNATPTPAAIPPATPSAGTAVTPTVPLTGTPSAPLLPTATPAGGAAGTPSPATTPAGTPTPLSV
ncbi:MAG: SH3 domain-containing protein, partial [Caldilineaceae bacterium]